MQFRMPLVSYFVAFTSDVDIAKLRGPFSFEGLF